MKDPVWETEELIETQPLHFAADRAGERLDVFCARASGETRSMLQRLIGEGAVEVDGKKAKANQKLRVGEDVSIVFAPPQETDILPEDIPIRIVYEDADIAVIDKEQGMVVHPAPGNPTGTLVNALMYQLKGPFRHRRRAASGDRPSNRQNDVRPYRGGKERRGAPFAGGADQEPYRGADLCGHCGREHQRGRGHRERAHRPAPGGPQEDGGGF